MRALRSTIARRTARAVEQQRSVGSGQTAMEASCMIRAPAEGDCCGGGCMPCVWDTYFDKLEAAEAAEGGAGGDPVAVRTVGDSEADPYLPPQNCVKVISCDDDTPHVPLTAPYANLSRWTVREITRYGSLTSLVLGRSAADTPSVQQLGNAPEKLPVVPVFVPNQPAVVDEILKLLGYDGSRQVKVGPNVFSAGINAPTYPHWIPQNTPMTVRELFTQYTDVASRQSVRPAVLHIAAEFAADPLEKAALARLASVEGVAEYRKRFRDASRPANLVTLLTAFQSSKPPLARLLSALPQHKAKLYSNGALDTPNTLSLLVSRPVGHTVRSLAAGFLCSLETGDSIQVGGPMPTIPHNLLRAPAVTGTQTHLLIAAGAGISPIVALIRNLRHRPAVGGLGLPCQPSPPSSPHRLVLYFGCRTRRDVPFPDELKSLTDELHVVASDTPSSSGGEKPANGDEGYLAILRSAGVDKYVWGALWRDRAAVRELVSRRAAYVSVCGPPLMERDTEQVIELILGTDAMQELKASDRWRVEKWGAGPAG
ncbi:NADPH--cytochrome P450 reductase [Diplonema papillatum]|nr:hypothetical protein DIPPA_12995 [Diplonema papillatum]KAJ9454213.1 NADPH--cytochrome P450 reductase [Diplonema papillatum]